MIQKLNETTVFFLLLKNLLVSKMCFSSVKKWISVRPYLLKYYPKKRKEKKTPKTRMSIFLNVICYKNISNVKIY